MSTCRHVCLCLFVYVSECTYMYVCIFIYVLASKDPRNSVVSNTELLERQDIVQFEVIPESKTVNKGMYTDILHRLWDAVRKETPWKMKKQQLVSPSWQRSRTLVIFGQWFLSKEQHDNTGASPILSSPGSCWFWTVPSTEIGVEGTALLWCYWYH